MRRVNSFSNSIIIFFFSAFAILFLFSACNQNKKVITFETLLNEMTNKYAITHFPNPQYSLKQFSSYDRKSVSPNKKGWYANSDWTQFLGKEDNDGRREFIMFDANGPGAIVRFWMTFSGKGASDGTLRIYIDGNKKPVIERNPLKILSGHLLAPDPLSSSVSPKTEYKKRGHNLYLPIPYSKHCKITYECNAIKFKNNQWTPSIYYNIDYRTYKQGVNIKSFTRNDLITFKPLIEKTAKILLNSEKSGDEEFNKTKTLALSEEISNELSEKGKAISKISIKMDAQDMDQALRSTVLRISFDGQKTVWVPVGAFFGTGYQIFPSKTWYTEVDKNGELEATWLMPFRKTAKISVINYGNQNVKVNLKVSVTKYKWEKSSMYFGASWHEYHGISTASNPNLENDDWHFDLNYVDLKGKGTYVGDAITVFNTANEWWGEGDEKIFVDGEDFPSCIGTGTEDYYGYAWCRPEKFTHPFIAQPTGAGNWNFAMTVNLRYRSLDAIPFNREISSNIGLWDWVKTRLNYATTAYWYAKPGFVSNIKPNIKSVKMPITLKRSDIIKPIVDKDGKLEGENLEVISYNSGTYHITYGALLSGKIQLMWKNGTVGDKLKTQFIINEGGKYKISAHFTKAPDYAKIQVSINGKTIPKSINCFNKSGTEVSEVNLGTHILHKGENSLTIKIIGTDRFTKPGNMVGLDYLNFDKIK